MLFHIIGLCPVLLENVEGCLAYSVAYSAIVIKLTTYYSAQCPMLGPKAQNLPMLNIIQYLC